MVQKTGTKLANGKLGSSEQETDMPPNLHKTAAGFIYRRVIPADARTAVGKREIKKSLGHDFRIAKIELAKLEVKTNAAIGAARAKVKGLQGSQQDLEAYLKKPGKNRTKLITVLTPELAGQISSLWLAGLQFDLDSRRSGLLDDDDYDDINANISEMLPTINRALATGQVSKYYPSIHSLMWGRGYELVLDQADWQTLTHDVLRAYQKSYQILQDRQAGLLSVPDTATLPLPLPAVWETASAQSPINGAPSWDEIFTQWNEDRPRPLATVGEAKKYLQSFATHCNKTPAQVAKVDVTEWLKNERATRGNSAKTLEKKGTMVGAIFSLALKDERLVKNPFAGFDYKRFVAKVGAENDDLRKPFTNEELALIFSDSGIFSVTKGCGGGGYHARVWLPILALLTGGRLDELGSLLVDDVLEGEYPRLIIRHAKNPNSIRHLPIHPLIVELGFLNYVNKMRASGHYKLWPGLVSKSPEKHGSEILGKWFNRFIRATWNLPATKVFHSFRHTFKDLCRNAGISHELHQALTGHSSQSVGDKYGIGFSPEVKQAEISRIKLNIHVERPKEWPLIASTKEQTLSKLGVSKVGGSARQHS